ncbi:methionine synthase [Tuwongella immobilis]|uniref:Methionine synthase n=1 Tax=Tuwongella immobilis TaxID=692036 RepID=A0A6C2YM78_9BACT|nr:methionine synthase [Tuwongella immobilis]VIP02022.1 methionine synthase : Methionine synthase OS=Gloeobacter kilaueensis JS1 GN=metH PE=4 SV=1: S-methyl_trans: Pterin_bind: B12-binding_2: B12-binding: Met_synt_B12 [Tuwongella immobilis]VTS00153.1 methionine synthase : Methionine synthase OS=Gloeobacter kilaueensis JS1 GN=metH PE=4 SV=1: S-methyl_trans: Pterin_bind: B12-binding_2: B12-binding: Met_synt_B12 [Tuwongella immobilis]
MPARFLDILQERVFILDGGMGTSIHANDPVAADWGGEKLVNLSDAMNFSRPEWISAIHKAYFEAGCDAVETNTFNGSRHVLAEFGWEDRVTEVNRRGVEIARDAANQYSTPSRPRFVVGSIGPGTKMPSLLNESIYMHFDEMSASYRPQIRAMIEAGVDALLIETCFDILQAKCVVITAIDVMKEMGVKVPLMVQVTIERTGTMLPGTDIAGALSTLEAFPEIDVIGLNCATGPDLMLSHVRYLSQYCSKKISVLPNAGLPENLNGKTHFPLGPEELAQWHERFVDEFGVNVIGGCCGTKPTHLKAVCDRIFGKKPAPRAGKWEPAVSSLFGSVNLMQDPRPMLIGERTNTNGSRKFKQLLEAQDMNGLVQMAQEQEREGVHVLDVCTAFVGRDEIRDMREVIKRYNEVIRLPIMVDSTEVPVMEEALKLISGKAILNSTNLEEGRHKLDKVAGLARKYGAALVCGCIDEHRGMARTAEHKAEVAKRIYDICTQEFGIPAHDLLFDPLVLPVSTGQIEERRNGLETIEGIRLIKERCPGALTTVGLSNVSFGLSPYTRQVVNSVFLHYCVQYGLDSAILHASKIVPLASIDEKGVELARRLIFAEYDQGDPLQELIEHYADRKAEGGKTKGASLGDSVEERLRQAIIQGRRDSLFADLELARETYTPIDIINNILLDGMKVVGELFGSGKMQLPFVLQSAEVMKAAVAALEPFMEKVEGEEKGKIVLATVKGDVHDIGKNLVDIILTNNGYKVYNIGIKQPVENMITAFQENQADAIGMSGLLVKSTVIMKEDLMTLNERGLTPPVILGGAALTRRYVEEDLTRLYRGKLFYGEDAFDGLRIMDKLIEQKKAKAQLNRLGSSALRGLVERANQPVYQNAGPGDGSLTVLPGDPAVNGNGNGNGSHDHAPGCCPAHDAIHQAMANIRRSPTLERAPNLPPAPFFGSKVLTDIDVRDVLQYLNERTLFSTQWQFRKGGVDPREYERQMQEVAIPALNRLKQYCLDENVLQPKAVYGFFPCGSDGNDLIVFEEDRRTEKTRFHFPRQDHGDYLCLADYFEPLVDGQPTDVVSLFAVTMGEEVSKRTAQLYEDKKYQDYLFLHGLGVEAAEALAEWFHRYLRQQWGIGADDSTQIQKLFKKHYRGCRYAFGYPACPNLADQVQLFQLIQPERIGLHLTESYLLEPEQSTTAIVTHHPKAKYFNVKQGGDDTMYE